MHKLARFYLLCDDHVTAISKLYINIKISVHFVDVLLHIAHEL